MLGPLHGSLARNHFGGVVAKGPQRSHAIEVPGNPTIRGRIENRIRIDGNDITADKHVGFAEEHIDVAVGMRFGHQRVVDRGCAERQAPGGVERLGGKRLRR